MANVPVVLTTVRPMAQRLRTEMTFRTNKLWTILINKVCFKVRFCLRLLQFTPLPSFLRKWRVTCQTDRCNRLITSAGVMSAGASVIASTCVSEALAPVLLLISSTAFICVQGNFIPFFDKFLHCSISTRQFPFSKKKER